VGGIAALRIGEGIKMVGAGVAPANTSVGQVIFSATPPERL
jgi:hypothetical protein